MSSKLVRLADQASADSAVNVPLIGAKQVSLPSSYCIGVDLESPTDSSTWSVAQMSAAARVKALHTHSRTAQHSEHGDEHTPLTVLSPEVNAS